MLRAMKNALVTGSVFVTLAIACGPGGKSPNTVTAATLEKERVEIGMPRKCLARQKIDSLIGKHGRAHPSASTEEYDSAALPVPRKRSHDGKSAEAAYELVAPSTVLLRTPHAMGTGIIVNAEKGLILTNFHVVEPGKEDDFSFKLHIDLGHLTPTGRMERSGKTYTGVVVKADPVRDLAIVKMVDPPTKLRAITIAERDPHIGEAVLAVGHAGIGFLWAAKGCQVASIGEQSHDMSMLQGISCESAGTGEDATASQARCEHQRKQLSEAVANIHQGLEVQTDCSITHGDSGGPLVSADGELLGINQSIRTDAATTSFHVHVAEVREFVKNIGDKPVQLPPDPWCEGGSFATLEDVDLDGTADTLITKKLGMYGKVEGLSLLIDLDQDTAEKRKKDPEAPFDAEVAVLTHPDRTFIYYDTDADGRLDVLLIDKTSDGIPDIAYRVGADETLTEDNSLLSVKDLDVSMIKDAASAARLGAIAKVIRPSDVGAFTSTAALTSAKVTPPDLHWGGKRKGLLIDSDGDGIADTLGIESFYTRGYLVDSDQDSPRDMKVGAKLKTLGNAEKFDAEAAFVEQAGSRWALYDTDGDNHMDLALLSPRFDDLGVALGAWNIAKDGSLTNAPENHGRRIFRLALAGARAKAAASKMGVVATDDGLNSFPNPKDPDADFAYRDVKGFPKVIIEAQSKTTRATMFDLDNDTKGDSKQTAEQLVNSGAFDAEVAYLYHGDLAWVFYDTDGDKLFDLVLWSFEPGTGKSVRAYRIDNATKKTTFDREASNGPLIRHSVFKNKAIGAKLKKIADMIYKPQAVED